MASNKKQKKNHTAKPVAQAIPAQEQKPRTIWMLLANVAILTVIVFSAVYLTERKGWFSPDNTNNHAQRKWDAYYQFTQKNEVDIVMVGNSHLYTGVNPKNLSCALGANCFILAAPGTTLTDAYYCLKEAITVCKPKIAVIETYAINDYRTHDFTKGALSDQLQSFHARKNLWQKLLSTPALFTSDNYLPAWSNTIRNHSYILTDMKQIRKNIEAKKTKKTQGLYLGRFVTSSTGMADSTLRKYDVPGAVPVVDGNNYSMSDEARHYLRKIVTLCRENNVEPVFLTVPMYYRHVKDYDVWKSRLAEELSQYDPVWLDLQSPYDFDAFIPACFENSVRSNQHLSYDGSLVCSYKLAHFLHDKFPDILPDRSADPNWNQLFYGEEGYFENYSPKPNDAAANLLFSNVALPNLSIKEIILLPKKEYNMLLIKIDKRNVTDLRGKTLRLLVDANYGGKQVVANIEAQTALMYNPLNHYLFVAHLRKDVSILGIRDVTVINN